MRLFVSHCKNRVIACDSPKTLLMKRARDVCNSVIAVSILSLASARVGAEVPSAVAIKDAHVVTVSGQDLPKATVLLRDGLIQDVGAAVQIPADAWVIDGDGLTVYPGFIDGLSNWGIPAPANVRASAAATATAAEPRAHGPEDRPQTYSFERAADLVNPSDARLEQARAAGFTSAATFPSRGIFEGQGALIDFAGQRGRDMVVFEPLGQAVEFRVSGFGGGARSGFPSSLMGNIAYVRQLYLDLGQYQQAKQIYNAHPSGNRRPEYDHALEGLAESPRILLPADREQQIDRILSFGPELKTPFLVYGLHEAYQRVDALKKANVPLLVSLKWPELPRDGNPADAPSFRDLTMRDKAPAVPGMLAKAGVKFVFYSDGIDSAVELKRALKKAIDGGLPLVDAIRALTLSVAEIYGLSDRLGSIDKGKVANLVVTKGEAFEEKTTVEYVFVDGKEFVPSREMQQGPASGAGGRRGNVPSGGISEEEPDGKRN